MKKLITLIMVTLLCVSCYDRSTHKDDATQRVTGEVPYVYTKQVFLKYSSFDFGQISGIQHFRYNGHDYIQFNVYDIYGGGFGIVHDPACPCGNAVK